MLSFVLHGSTAHFVFHLFVVYVISVVLYPHFHPDYSSIFSLFLNSLPPSVLMVHDFLRKESQSLRRVHSWLKEDL